MAEPDKFVVTYEDHTGKRGTSTHYFTTGLTLVQIAEGVEAFVGLIDDTIGAIIRAVNVLIPVVISTLTGNTATSSSDVEEVGQFIAATAANRVVEINIPCIDSTLLSAGSDDLDQSDTDIAAFISMLEDGLAVTGGTMIPCDIGGDDIIALVTARKMARNSGGRA